jgi:MSHA biogenesis protein MshN
VAEEPAAAAGDKEAVVVERVAAVPAQDAEPAAEKEAVADAGADEATPAAAPVRPAAPARSGGDKPARTVSAGKTVAVAPIREMTPQQKAEADYKRANASLQEGRITEAVATLERALQQDPRHEAARQTLAGLLIEARRSDEAIRVLQAGLVLEPNQPNMAMLLARLQIERGGPGIETLQRTLPYAEGNAEYHAFLAGALQREQRHREAVEHYTTAIRHGGQNGVWLMGLGISLLAEKRNPEALDAFRRAKASGNLTPELAAYVDRRLQALAK